jgi:hypothetical protein
MALTAACRKEGRNVKEGRKVREGRKEGRERFQ